MSWWGDLLRRARIRSVKEGKVQTARTEATENDAKDDAERWQDYGFAGNPGDGQGLVINAGGHTIVLRLDRIAERPQLAAYEVAVWHKEGHMVRLKAGRVVQVDCDQFVVNASAGVSFNTPTVNASGDIVAALTVQAPTIDAATSLKVVGKEMSLHAHIGVQTGTGTSGPPA
jgi:phage baseplate assembly protein V